MGDQMNENAMIINPIAFLKIHNPKTSVPQSPGVKESYEAIVGSLLLYLKQVGGGAITPADDSSTKVTEVITRIEIERNNNKQSPVRPIVNCSMKEDKALKTSAGGGNGAGKTAGDSLINGNSYRRISMKCVPLVTEKGIQGVIYVHFTKAPQGFPKHDLLFLFINHLDNPAALAIENILLHEKNRRVEEALENARAELERRVKERTSELMEANRKLNELSITDGLTGLFNHRHFLRELESEYRRALRYRRSLALLLLDIDHFKEVNDRYGHPCGDFVLKNIAGLLKGCLRSADIAARCGGDELAILLPETNKSKAWEVAEKLRRQLEKSPFEWNGESFNITCSIGVAAFPDLGIDTWHSLLESADKSLYRAKGEGRNNVIVFNSCKRKAVPTNGQSRSQQALRAEYLDFAPVSRNRVQGISYTTDLSSTINGLERGQKNRVLRSPLLRSFPKVPKRVVQKGSPVEHDGPVSSSRDLH
jgi:diguanylate cyclase (GGDEF)-like protein